MIWLSKRLLFLITFFLITFSILVVIGVVGFVWIEQYSVIDAFYMTVITISTVGFGEIHELSSTGRIFTSLLIITSFVSLAYAITSITSYLIGTEYRNHRNHQKLMEDLSQLKNHVIVCGFGRVGKQVAYDLSLSKTPFVIIEQDPIEIESCELKDGFLFYKGNATDDDSLLHCNLDKAKAIICCLPSDSENLYVVLSAREKSEKVLIISRAIMLSSISKLKFAGANNVILPDTIGGSHMASLVTNPDVMEFMDIIGVQKRAGSNVASIHYDQLPTHLQNKTIGAIRETENLEVNIVGMKMSDGHYMINPNAEVVFQKNCNLFVLGTDEQLKNFKNYFHLNH